MRLERQCAAQMIQLRPELLPVSQMPHSEPLLGAVAFGGDPSVCPRIVLPLRQLGGEPAAEVWRAAGPVTSGCDEGIAYARSGGVLLGAILAGDGDLEATTRDAYTRLLGFARDAGTPHLLRVWNHVRDINAIEDGLERYRRFCIGRYDAFAAAGYRMGSDLPSASAVGTHVPGLLIYFVASSEPGVQIENPRQVSAWEYPRQYGPKSPSFSRATAGAGLTFIAGTSSVVGHDTLHAGDVEAQVEETVRNLERIVDLRSLAMLKVYVRHAADRDRIAARVDALIGAPAVYVEADICRGDLLVEIEGVAAS
jgi:chorismate lyase/3-hydroxybenzoate synthase